MDWQRSEGRELFRMCEYTCGNITGTYARIGEKYYYANRHTTKSHDDLYLEIEEDTKWAFRNYNLGREVDAKTADFERELEALVNKYDAEMETESFDKEGKA